jgi:deoxyadenosine/deoxycytidine kinase
MLLADSFPDITTSEVIYEDAVLEDLLEKYKHFGLECDIYLPENL